MKTKKPTTKKTDTDPTRAALHRLKRKFGMERARLDRWSANSDSSREHRDRCLYEANQWSAAMSMLDEEIRKVKG